VVIATVLNNPSLIPFIIIVLLGVVVPVTVGVGEQKLPMFGLVIIIEVVAIDLTDTVIENALPKVLEEYINAVNVIIVNMNNRISLD